MKRAFVAVVVCSLCGLILSSLPASSPKSKEGPAPGQVRSTPVPVPQTSLVLAVAEDDKPAPKEKPKPPKPQPKEDGPKPEKPGPGPKGAEKPKPVPGPFKFPKEITPTPEQEAQRDALVKKFAPQQEALAEMEKGVYTAEQQEKMKAVREAAHADGKKGKEANDLVAAAIKLSPQQQEKLEGVHQKRKALDEQIKAAMLDLLTPQQRELAAKKGPGGPGGPKPKGPPPKKDAKP
jgi:hypothetical protein